MGYIRGRGPRRLTYVLDATDGLNRASGAPALVKLNKTLNDTDMRAAYIASSIASFSLHSLV